MNAELTEADSPVFVYSPIGREEARTVARTLVEEGLVACVNILAPHKAVYRWEGKVVEDDGEVVLLMKTTEARVEAAVARLEELHPYELPVIFWWEVGATSATLDWLVGSRPS